MIRTLFLLLLIFIGINSLATAGISDDPRMKAYDVIRYELSISFDTLNQSFFGSIALTAMALEATDSIIISASNETITIDSVKADGKNIRSFKHFQDHLRVPFRSIPTTSFVVTVYFRGKSNFSGEYEGGGVFFSRGSDGVHIGTISQPFFARNWWPCKDIPSDKAASMKISLRVPSPLIAVSNGILTDKKSENGWTTYEWKTDYPIATYLVSVAVARFATWTDSYTRIDGRTMPITNYAFPDDSAKAKVDFENGAKILDFFAKTFCEYPFADEKFGYVEVDGQLTIENQTVVSIEKSLITGEHEAENTIVHETSHQWWGNMITPVDWRHTWLSEGFATFAQALYVEHRRGDSVYQQFMDALMSSPNGSYAGSVIGQSDTSFWDSFHIRVYYKGAIVLHMLRRMLGDPVFLLIMRTYTNHPDFQYKNASTEDFIRICETVSNKDLRWFFDQWVYAKTDSIDRPVVKYSWDVVSNENSLNLHLEQITAAERVYRLPLTVTMIMPSGRIDTAFIVDSLAMQTFALPVKEKPTTVEINRRKDVFVDIIRRGDE